jgi:hypothetical protein
VDARAAPHAHLPRDAARAADAAPRAAADSRKGSGDKSDKRPATEPEASLTDVTHALDKSNKAVSFSDHGAASSSAAPAPAPQPLRRDSSRGFLPVETFKGAKEEELSMARLNRVTSLLNDQSKVANRSRARSLLGDGGGGGGGRSGGLNEDDTILIHKMAADIRFLRKVHAGSGRAAGASAGALAAASGAPEAAAPSSAFGSCASISAADLGVVPPAASAAVINGGAWSIERLALEVAELKESQETQTGQLLGELAEVRAELVRIRMGDSLSRELSDPQTRF